jgi:hypothetical protein
MPHTGQCFCGQVSLSINGEPKGARFCWCRDCQRIASGSATVNVLFDEAAVSFSGEIGRLEKVADSGNRVERGFCTRCGSQIFSRTIAPQGQPIRIRAGVLDDPELATPSGVIWAASAPSWAPMPEGLPRHAQGPGSPLMEDEA